MESTRQDFITCEYCKFFNKRPTTYETTIGTCHKGVCCRYPHREDCNGDEWCGEWRGNWEERDKK